MSLSDISTADYVSLTDRAELSTCVPALKKLFKMVVQRWHYMDGKRDYSILLIKRLLMAVMVHYDPRKSIHLINAKNLMWCLEKNFTN